MTTKKYKTSVDKVNVFINTIVIFLCSVSSVYAEVDIDSNKTVQTVSYEHVISWSLGLIVVLCLFFACIWMMRRLGALPTNSKGNLRVLAGLSLGMREKILLVQIGEKQLVLGVTPGKIDNLLVLEGDEQLFQDNDKTVDQGSFADKLKQFMSDPKR